MNFGPLVAPVRFKRIGTKVWAFLRDRGLPSNVQRALCTVKAVSKTYRLPSARLRIAGAPISIHILGSWSPYTPNGTFREKLCNLGPKAALPSNLYVSHAFSIFSNYSYNCFP